MKIKALSLCAAVLAAAVIFGGCKGDDANQQALQTLTPPQVVERVITSIRTGESGAAIPLFAAPVDKQVLKAFLDDQIATMDIQSVQVNAKFKETKKTALVEYAFVYIEKSQAKDGIPNPGRKMRKLGAAILVKEDGVWKVRLYDVQLDDSGDKTLLTALDSDLDNKVEEKLFKDCALTVALTKLAQEMYAGDNKGDFTNSKDMLTQYITDYDPATCESLEIHGIGVNEKGDNDFKIMARTKNMPSCTIWATREKIYPETFEKMCLGQKNPLDL